MVSSSSLVFLRLNLLKNETESGRNGELKAFWLLLATNVTCNGICEKDYIIMVCETKAVLFVCISIRIACLKPLPNFCFGNSEIQYTLHAKPTLKDIIFEEGPKKSPF